MRRHDNKGRSYGSGQYIPIPHVMAKSAAWRSLSGGAAKLYIELHSRFNGFNNGDLSVSYSEAAKLLSLGKSTVKRAFDELTEKGFVVRTSEGHWYGRKAATWRLTAKVARIPKYVVASNGWKDWVPAKK